MCTESNLLPSLRKPLVPVWVSVLLYLIVAIILMGIVNILSVTISSLLPDSIYFKITGQLIEWFIAAVFVTLTAYFFLSFLDRTSISELGLSIKNRRKDILTGLLWAVVLYAIGFTVSLLSGSVSIFGIKFDGGVLILTFMLFLCASIVEEVMIRGYIQSRLMTKMNKFLALVVASVIFSILHIPNPNIGLFPLINLFLAGVMLGAAFLYTHNLWFPISLHLAWNWIQGPVLGYEVSGTKMFPTLLTLELPEENLINGGAFGFEGSIICSILMIISIFVIIGWGESKLRKTKITNNIL